MIKSEEVKKEITRDIERWVDNVKIKQYLRDYDIPSLVDMIMDNIYPITLSCGHQVRDFNEGAELEFEDFITDRSDTEHGGGIGTITGLYCKDCVKLYKKEGLIIREIK